MPTLLSQGVSVRLRGIASPRIAFTKNECYEENLLGCLPKFLVVKGPVRQIKGLGSDNHNVLSRGRRKD